MNEFLFYQALACMSGRRRLAGGILIKKYTIYKQIGALSKPNNGWTKELNLVSWGDREPVYDIRTWNAGHTGYGRGVTLTAGQMAALKALLDERNIF